MAKKFNFAELLNERSKGLASQTEETQELVMIDVDNLVPSNENFYAVDNELKRRIELMGVLQPLLVTKPEEGKYKIIAGHRRRLAILALVEEGKEKFRSVPCMIATESVNEHTARIIANSFREKKDWERMMEIIELEKDAEEIRTKLGLKGKTREVLSALTKISESQIARYKAIANNLIPELMEEFRKERVNFSVATEACGLPEEWQKKAMKTLEETGELSLPSIKTIKQQAKETEQIPEQTEISELEEFDGMQRPEEPEPEAEEVQEYIEPEPEAIVSICYSCHGYEGCNRKGNTITNCNAYINRAEVRKTDEQKYAEEQERIDRETKRKLREQEETSGAEPIKTRAEQRPEKIRLAPSRYREIAIGLLDFLLVKKNGYTLGAEVGLIEYKDGQPTGAEMQVTINYIMEDWTGLEYGYCIIGFRNGKEKNE